MPCQAETIGRTRFAQVSLACNVGIRIKEDNVLIPIVESLPDRGEPSVNKRRLVDCLAQREAIVDLVLGAILLVAGSREVHQSNLVASGNLNETGVVSHGDASVCLNVGGINTGGFSPSEIAANSSLSSTALICLKSAS